MSEEVILQNGTVLVRRQRLAAGEAGPWHSDSCRRVTVVLSGEALSIEYHDGGAADRVYVAPGLADWDEPTTRVHRAINIGATPYEEIVVFFLDAPGAEPQPRVP
jgi:hypothetical protein